MKSQGTQYKHKSAVIQKEISDVLYGNQTTSMCVPEEKKHVKKLCCEQQNNSVEMVNKRPKFSGENCVVDLNEKGDGITINVTYNKQKVDDRCIVNVYPVINIAGGLSSGHLIIVNVHVNIEKD